MRHVDIFPTLFPLLNFDIPSNLDGVNLSPLWKNEKHAPKPENWTRILQESAWDEDADGPFHRKMREELGVTTLRARHLHRLDKALKGWAVRLLQDFDEGISLNAYYSTGVKDIGVPWHADEGDVFILELAGERRWQVSRNRIGQPEDVNGEAPALHDSFDLKAGDLLYIPHNFPHRTQSLSATFSLHLTVQILRRESSMVVAWLTEVLKEKLGARYETLFPLAAAEGEEAQKEKFEEIRSILGATLAGQDAFAHFQRHAFKEAGSSIWPKMTQGD